jgi:5-methylcytosine-specific restriction enzyme subunit McrC
MPDIVECDEMAELPLPLNRLLRNGELRLNGSIQERGYLGAKIKGGHLVLTASRFIGLIPLTDDLSVRVRPKMPISNLSRMLVRSGTAPRAIEGFHRGYHPRFEGGVDAIRTYGPSLLNGVDGIIRRGLSKAYIPPPAPMPWRGRMNVSDTVRRYAARGIHYQHTFEQTVLSVATLENIALRTAVLVVRDGLSDRAEDRPMLTRATTILSHLPGVPNWNCRIADLAHALSRRLAAPGLSAYRPTLWTALLLLQSQLVDVETDGFIRLDSLIVDVSKVFEGYLRRELSDRLRADGLRVSSGDTSSLPFFQDRAEERAKPDIIIWRERQIVGLIEVKYKENIKETDRYQLTSFLDAADLKIGALVSPAIGGETSSYWGTTKAGKSLLRLKFDLSVPNLDVEADKFADNVRSMLAGSHQLI